MVRKGIMRFLNRQLAEYEKDLGKLPDLPSQPEESEDNGNGTGA